MKKTLSDKYLNKIWITSDTHFGHKNIAGSFSNWDSGYRNFDSVEEMNEELQYQTNKHVHENDILFHLGDFSFVGGSPRFFRDFINCKEIHVILGNHDKFRQKDINSFSSVSNYMELNIGKDKFCMSHYPMLVWNKHHHGSYMLHGHCQGSLYNYGNSIYNRRVLDVGVDLAYKLTGDYRPFKLTEIIDILKDKPIQFIDHHNKKTND